jgi:hypothetical protein
VKAKNRILAVGGAMLVGSAALAADGVTPGGFIAPNYRIVNNSKKEDKALNRNEFTVFDGAFSLTGKKGSSSAYLFLPIAYDTSTSATNTFTIGKTRAEAYVKHTFDVGFTATLGQFAKIWGYEGFSANQRPFTTATLIPVIGETITDNGVAASPHFSASTLDMGQTDTGLQVSYPFSDMLTFSFLVVNYNGQGRMLKQGDISAQTGTAPNIVAASPSHKNKYDIGFKVDTTMGDYGAGLYYLLQRPADKRSNQFFDFVGTTKVGDLDLAAEVFYFKASGSDAATGLGVRGIYALDSELAAGARLEYNKSPGKDTNGGSRGKEVDVKKYQVTFGPQYKLSQALTVRADYTLLNSQRGSAKASNTSTFAADAVYNF